MPLESVEPAGWRESLDPFAPLPADQDMLSAMARSEELTSQFAQRCAAIDGQLRERLSNLAEVDFLSGMRSWSVTLDEHTSEEDFAQVIGDIPVRIMPKSTFTALG